MREGFNRNERKDHKVGQRAVGERGVKSWRERGAEGLRRGVLEGGGRRGMKAAGRAPLLVLVRGFGVMARLKARRSCGRGCLPEGG